MQIVIDGLAELCSLRDRNDLDMALVRLVVNSGRGLITDSKLIRLVGDESQIKCITKAGFLFGSTSAEDAPLSSDFQSLPDIRKFPWRLQAFNTERTVVGGEMPELLEIPIFSAGQVTSILEVSSYTKIPAENIAAIVGIARLYENFEGLLDYGERDALTELLNRKTFDGALSKVAQQNEVRSLARGDARALKPEETHWIAVIDIDHFKAVNDNFGHPAGDKVLSVLAQLMRQSFRSNDQLYRFGGEEFVVLMKCSGHEDACAALERFRSCVDKHNFPGVGHITASLGLAELRRTDMPGDAVERADRALYHAKDNGRNQVCSYQEVFEAQSDIEQVALRA